MLKRLLVLLLLSALALGAACGGDGDDGDGATTPVPTAPPNATSTPPPQSTTGTVLLDAMSVAVGGTLTATGTGWRGEGPLSFYLLTEEQSADNQSAARAIANGETVKLGEADADADGAVSFQFTLEASPATEGGDTLTVESGAELTVLALQGSSGSRSEPFTVQ
jgi:hypothetical protein